MNTFLNDTQPWTKICDEELIKFYVDDALSVLDISNIMNRYPENIIIRLVELKVIATRQSARGYNEYIDKIRIECLEELSNSFTEEDWKELKMLEEFDELDREKQSIYLDVNT